MKVLRRKAHFEILEGKNAAKPKAVNTRQQMLPSARTCWYCNGATPAPPAQLRCERCNHIGYCSMECRAADACRHSEFCHANCFYIPDRYAVITSMPTGEEWGLAFQQVFEIVQIHQIHPNNISFATSWPNFEPEVPKFWSRSSLLSLHLLGAGALVKDFWERWRLEVLLSLHLLGAGALVKDFWERWGVEVRNLVELGITLPGENITDYYFYADIRGLQFLTLMWQAGRPLCFSPIQSVQTQLELGLWLRDRVGIKAEEIFTTSFWKALDIYYKTFPFSKTPTQGEEKLLVWWDDWETLEETAMLFVLWRELCEKTRKEICSVTDSVLAPLGWPNVLLSLLQEYSWNKVDAT